MRRSWSCRNTVLAVAAAFIAAMPAAAQGTATISGTITDSTTGTPVPAVQVVVVGSTRGAVTDDAGRYAIRGLDAGTVTVRAQRIGYRPASRSVTLAEGATVDLSFAVAEAARVLTEVVSIGYGTDTRAEVTSAVTTVNPEAVQSTPVAGVDAALQGRAAGVQVTQNAGNPGVGITVRIRGSASLTASNQPLYVVDGIPLVREDFSQIGVGGQDVTAVTGLNPDEIEAISILKDAAAAAIYGSRASNGVVLVTTKRGRANQSRIGVDAYTGIQRAARRWDLLNAQEYLMIRNESERNDIPTRVNFFGTPGVDDTVDTDWQEEVFRQAPVSNVTLNADGGTDRVQYYVSGSLFDQTGIVLASGYQRAGGRVNLDFSATSKLRLSTSLAVARESHQRIENDNTIEGIGANAIALAPTIPVRRPDGNYTAFADGLEYINPVAIAEFNEIETRTLRTFGNVEAAYNPIPALRVNARFGADVMNLRDLRWDSPAVEDSYAFTVNGVSTQASTTSNRYVSELFGTFSPSFQNQDVTVTAGTSFEWNGAERSYVQGEGFASEGFRYPGAATKVTSYDGGWTGNNLASVFGRVNYSLLRRFQVMASLRADGSSRFGENNRWGVFPAASVGYTISDEPMFARFLGNNTLKVRASTGYTGNQAIPQDFGSLERYARANYAEEIGLAQISIANPDLRWESTREVNAGVDLTVLSGRVSVIADYYQKLTSDLLVSKPISATSGLTSRLENVGSIKNAGVELELTTRNLVAESGNGLEWTTEFNIAANRNKVVSLYNGQPFPAGLYSMNRVEVGRPLGEFYAFEFAGVDPANGNALYFDSLGKKVLATQLQTKDRRFIGTPHPDYQGGLTNTLAWGGFDVRAFLQFSQGNQIFNAMRVFADDAGRYADNKFSDILRRWQKPGDVTDQPRLSRRGRSGAVRISSRYLEDGSYVRLGEVTVGYRLPEQWAGMVRTREARVYLSGRNLHTWTKYTGYSPDVNSGGSGSNLALGTDFYTYPFARTFTFGVKAQF